jgi:hypothetical protein
VAVAAARCIAWVRPDGGGGGGGGNLSREVSARGRGRPSGSTRPARPVPAGACHVFLYKICQGTQQECIYWHASGPFMAKVCCRAAEGCAGQVASCYKGREPQQEGQQNELLEASGRSKQREAGQSWRAKHPRRLAQQQAPPPPAAAAGAGAAPQANRP